ncbi:MAG: DUF5060 domain-containing protein [Mariniblastus sp.]
MKVKTHVNFSAQVLLGMFCCFAFTSQINADDLSSPIVAETNVFQEKDGLVVVEAEHFNSQSATEKRAFYLTASDKTPKFDFDGDETHLGGASNGAYLEILPDTRRNHGEKLIAGENFSNAPGKLAILSYKVNFSQPGRYYVWVRAHSTGTEDNGLHVGLDGEWPESGRRLQWCEGKNTWRWDSMQRTEKVHCGVPHQIFLDIKTAGEHVVHFSMREDGFEFDRWLMTRDRDFARPVAAGPEASVATEKLAEFPLVEAPALPATPEPVADPANATNPTSNQGKSNKVKAGQVKQNQAKTKQTSVVMRARDFETDGTNFYVDQDKWLAVNPDVHKSGTARKTFPFPTGNYVVVLRAVGENDGQSTYEVSVGSKKLNQFKCPLSKEMFETGQAYNGRWEKMEINNGEMITVTANIGSADGAEYSRARWAAIAFRPADDATKKLVAPILRDSNLAKDSAVDTRDRSTSPTTSVSKTPLVDPRKPDGDGSVSIAGETKQWHNIMLTLDGPYAHENDNSPNPFLDYRMEVVFTHTDGTTYKIPGYFAADGNASESSAAAGTKWRAHFAPDRTGSWNYSASVVRGDKVAINSDTISTEFVRQSGTIEVSESDKKGRDLRNEGRLQYVGSHYLQHAGSKRFFLKAGADAPETLLGYADFDNTIMRKKNVPLKTFAAHMKDWSEGDPSWKDGKGKGLIGAVNYLSGKGCNAFSFLTYNAGGDGDNVWPFVQREDKLHYDCSKLDQWGIVFEHGTRKGMYLHFKLQETENDDHNARNGNKEDKSFVPTSLDGGNLGVQRKLYLREMIARFGHNLALNWNLGEENTQTMEQQQAMIDFIAANDPYHHLIVCHTYPDQQDKVYKPLLGDKSKMTGVSLQNSSIHRTHDQTVKWVRESAKSGKPWVVAFDESGTAAHGQCPDLGYQGFDGRDKTGEKIYDQHAVRRSTLWGTLMGGGAGVEYYFGYKFVENDLVCEDWRSRDQSWDYCRIALEFFRDNNIPVQLMRPSDELVGNAKLDNSKYCFSQSGEVYLVYLPKSGSTKLDLTGVSGEFSVQWFNPRTGGDLTNGPTPTVSGGGFVLIDSGKSDGEDRLAVIKRRK